jgi:hypothetical protein
LTGVIYNIRAVQSAYCSGSDGFFDDFMSHDRPLRLEQNLSNS